MAGEAFASGFSGGVQDLGANASPLHAHDKKSHPMAGEAFASGFIAVVIKLRTCRRHSRAGGNPPFLIAKSYHSNETHADVIPAQAGIHPS